jgi:NET1-associated nuclear protein 1 (U3 small nucleolar RNA-associated protein 17)
LSTSLSHLRGDSFCTFHPDNKIIVVHWNLDVSAVIQGLVKDRRVSTGLMVDPRTKALVLNGKPII